MHEIYVYVCTCVYSTYVCVLVCIYYVCMDVCMCVCVFMYEITEWLFYRCMNICALTQLRFLKYLFIYISLISHFTATATRTLLLLDAYNLLSSLQ